MYTSLLPFGLASTPDDVDGSGVTWFGRQKKSRVSKQARHLQGVLLSKPQQPLQNMQKITTTRGIHVIKTTGRMTSKRADFWATSITVSSRVAYSIVRSTVFASAVVTSSVRSVVSLGIVIGANVEVIGSEVCLMVLVVGALEPELRVEGNIVVSS